MDRHKLYLSKIIHVKRNAENLSLDKLSELTNISKSYLSRLENAYSVNNTTYLHFISIILNKLNIAFYHDGQEFIELKSALDAFYKAIVFVNVEEAKKLYRQLLENENKYIHSTLVVKFMIYKYVWLTLIHADNREIENQVGVIENLKEIIAFEKNELQIYLDYKGSYFDDLNLEDRAIATLQEAKELGYNEYTYGMICYHLGVVQVKKNNLAEALYMNQVALEHFIKEYNYKRQCYTQVHTANIYALLKQYQKADEIYNSIINNDCFYNIENIKDFVMVSKTWNLVLQKDYHAALDLIINYIKPFKFKLINPAHIYHLAWCYYKLKDNKKALKYIKYKNSFDQDNFVYKCHLETIEVLIQFENNNNYIINHLKLMYEAHKYRFTIDAKKFYLNLLVEKCEANYKYKDALYYYKQLYE